MTFKITENAKCELNGQSKYLIRDTINLLNMRSGVLSSDVIHIVDKVEKHLKIIVQEAFDEGRKNENGRASKKTAISMIKNCNR